MDENILWLEISVGNRKGMAVRETMYDLFEICKRLEWGEPSTVHYEVKEFSTFNPFKNEETMNLVSQVFNGI